MENIELDNLSNTSEIIYERETPLWKRIKTNVLDFLRHNYLSILKFLSLIIVILIVIIVILTIKVNLQAKTASSFTSTTKSPLNTETFSHSEILTQKVETNPTTLTKYHLLKHSTSKDDVSPIKVGEEQVSKFQFNGTSCGRINCKTGVNFCTPKFKTYLTIKRYVCCCKDEFPISVTFKHYFYNLQTKNIILLFSSPDDITKLSALDLKYYPQLKNLPGVWSVVQESDTQYYLQYNLVEDSNPDDPDEEA